MEPRPEIAAAIAAAQAISPTFLEAPPKQVLLDLAAVEQLGRIVDALRVSVAAAVEHQSRPELGEERLSFREGARDGAELVRQVARIGHSEAKRRVGLGKAFAPRLVLGVPQPGPSAVLADAVTSGLVGLESARVIINARKSLRKRVMAKYLDGMVVQLTDAAMSNDTEQLREIARAWADFFDPDGIDPDAAARRRLRALTIGKTCADGTTRATVVLTPEHLALLQELCQSARRGVKLVRTEPGSDKDEDTSGGEWREEETEDDGTEPRTRAQQDYDTLMQILEAGAKAEQADVATQVTHETVVTITAAELEDQRGRGWMPGVLAGIPIPVIEQRICNGGTRLLVLGDEGEPLHFGQSRRLFSPAQRKSMMVSAGGRCQYPGCRTPSPYLEAHHADWFKRDGGPTDVENGIMLCSYHHHLIHAKHSPVKIVRHERDLWIVPQRWSGPPEEHHRRQSGPFRDPRLDELRRMHDPDRSPWGRPRAA